MRSGKILAGWLTLLLARVQPLVLNGITINRKEYHTNEHRTHTKCTQNGKNK